MHAPLEHYFAAIPTERWKLFLHLLNLNLALWSVLAKENSISFTQVEAWKVPRRVCAFFGLGTLGPPFCGQTQETLLDDEADTAKPFQLPQPVTNQPSA